MFAVVASTGGSGCGPDSVPPPAGRARWSRNTAVCSREHNRGVFSDPAAAAWVAAGSPRVDAPPPRAGRCARCGAVGPTVTSSRIVGEKFTGFDGWPFGSRRLCTPCAWAYSQPPTKQTTRLITTAAVTEYPNPAALADLLAAGKLAPTHAVVLPTARRRYILPTAQWGHLATDGLVLPWDAGAAALLADLLWLRAAFTLACRDGADAHRRHEWHQLSRPIAPTALLTTQPPDQLPRILTTWTALQPWRQIPPLWAAARLLTNPD